MTKNQVFPGGKNSPERKTVPEHVLDYIQGMLLPYHVTWDRVYEAITASTNDEAKATTQDSFLSTEEIGELLHVSRVTIFRYMRAGKIQAHKLGRRNLFSLNEVIATLKNEEVANV